MGSSGMKNIRLPCWKPLAPDSSASHLLQAISHLLNKAQFPSRFEHPTPQGHSVVAPHVRALGQRCVLLARNLRPQWRSAKVQGHSNPNTLSTTPARLFLPAAANCLELIPGDHPTCSRRLSLENNPQSIVLSSRPTPTASTL